MGGNSIEDPDTKVNGNNGTEGYSTNEDNMFKGLGNKIKEGAGVITEYLGMNWRNIGRTTAITLLLTGMAYSSACTNQDSSPTPAAMAFEQDTVPLGGSQQEETMVKPTPTVIVEPTLTAEEIREQRIDKIIEVVEANPNTFTVEEIDAYLQEHETNWKGSVQDFIDGYKGVMAPFQYVFVRNNYEKSGILLSPGPYQHAIDMTMKDRNSFPTPVVVDEEMLGKETESIYDRLHFKNPDGTLGWEREPGKYTVIVYITEGIGSEGQLIDEKYYSIGGYSFVIPVVDEMNEEGEDIEYVSLEEIYSRNLSNEQIDLLEQASIYIPAGYTKFSLDEEGKIIWTGSNFKELGLPQVTSASTEMSDIN